MLWRLVTFLRGKRAVQRQQLVYTALNEQISSGVIHAVTMKLFTQQEWEQRVQVAFGSQRSVLSVSKVFQFQTVFFN